MRISFMVDAVGRSPVLVSSLGNAPRSRPTTRAVNLHLQPFRRLQFYKLWNVVTRCVPQM